MASDGKILITGAGGFIGQALAPALAECGFSLRLLFNRSADIKLPQHGKHETIIAGDLGGGRMPEGLFYGVTTVIHLAALSHQSGRFSVAGDRYFTVNLDVALALALAARQAGVRQFVFFSTAKVYGEGSWDVKKKYRLDDRPAPRNPYAVSKWRAEQELQKLVNSEFSLTIIRSPLVYGAGAKGNIGALNKWLHLGLPLPVTRVENFRSMVSRDKLVALVADLLAAKQTGFQLLLPADDQDWSSRELARYLLTKNPGTIKVPDSFLAAIRYLLSGNSCLLKLFGHFRLEKKLSR